jgi:hypothetical protein
MSSRGIATMAIVAVVVVIIIIAAVAGVLLLGKSSSTTTPTTSTPITTTSSVTTPTSVTSTSTSSSLSSSTSTSSAASGTGNVSAAVEAATNTHVSYIESRNIPQVLTQYTSHPTVVWTGNTGSLGGTYSGIENIQILYSGSLSSAKQIALTIQNYSSNTVSSSQVNSTFGMNMTGYSPILGNISGIIQVSIEWVYNGTGWQIQNENWNYVVFNTTVKGGATTFPQWHTPSRESPDPFKNFVFHIGGPAYAFVIFGYAAVLIALLLTFMFRRSRATPVSRAPIQRKSTS